MRQFRPKLFEPDPPFLVSLSLWTSLALVYLAVAILGPPPEVTETVTLPDRVVEVFLKPDPPTPEQQGEVLSNPNGPTIPGPAQPIDDFLLENPRTNLEIRSALLQRRAELQVDGGDRVLDLLHNTPLGHAEVADGAGLRGGPTLEDATVGPIAVLGGGEATMVATQASLAPTRNFLPEAINATPTHTTPTTALKHQIRQYNAQVRHCYMQRIKENPRTSGRLMVQVDIEDGRVQRIHFAEDTIDDPELNACIQRRIRTWRFSPDTNQNIALPFAFSPSQ